MTIWSEASADAIQIARRIIEQYHPWLKEANIGLLFRDKASKSQGLNVYAKASKVNDRLKVWLDYDIIIWVSEEDWTGWEPKIREALIDHELCHCSGSPGDWKIRGHDFEDFNCIIERHGYWNPALLQIQHADAQHYARQLDLLGNALETKHGKVEAIKTDAMEKAGELDQPNGQPAAPAYSAEPPKEDATQSAPEEEDHADPFADFFEDKDIDP